MPFRDEMCDELNGKIGKNENEKNDETFYSEKLANLIRSGYFLDFADEAEKMKRNMKHTRRLSQTNKFGFASQILKFEENIRNENSIQINQFVQLIEDIYQKASTAGARTKNDENNFYGTLKETISMQINLVRRIFGKEHFVNALLKQLHSKSTIFRTKNFMPTKNNYGTSKIWNKHSKHFRQRRFRRQVIRQAFIKAFIVVLVVFALVLFATLAKLPSFAKTLISIILAIFLLLMIVLCDSAVVNRSEVEENALNERQLLRQQEARRLVERHTHIWRPDLPLSDSSLSSTNGAAMEEEIHLTDSDLNARTMSMRQREVVEDEEFDDACLICYEPFFPSLTENNGSQRAGDIEVSFKLILVLLRERI